jgi:hypothetical protein
VACATSSLAGSAARTAAEDSDFEDSSSSSVSCSTGSDNDSDSDSESDSESDSGKRAARNKAAAAGRSRGRSGHRGGGSSLRAQQEALLQAWTTGLRNDPVLARGAEGAEVDSVAALLQALLAYPGVRVSVACAVLAAASTAPCYSPSWLMDAEQKLVQAALHRNSVLAAACLDMLPAHSRQSREMVQGWRTGRRLGILAPCVQAHLLRHTGLSDAVGGASKRCFRRPGKDGVEVQDEE